LDLGQVVAGNFAGAILANFGADVIKIESPKGDQLRSLRVRDDVGTSLWWRCHNRNKRCVTVDLHKDAGRDILRRLAQKSDVLIENFRPGVMEGWKLGPGDLPPSLVYARISGYGQTGPLAKLPGYGSVCEAFGGFRYINGYPDRPPVRPNTSLGDNLAGIHAALGIVMSLLHQQRMRGMGDVRAPGQVVDAAISESVFNMMEACVSEYLHAGVERQPSGSTISGVVPSGTFKTKDGHWVVIGGNGDSVYSRLMSAIGRPDMGASNPRYATNADRMKHEGEVMGAIAEWCEGRTRDEVQAAMDEARVPAGPILSVGDITRNEQYAARGMIEEAPVPGHSFSISVPAIPPILSRTPGKTWTAGADLGYHTKEVLMQELGMSEVEVERLRAQGVI